MVFSGLECLLWKSNPAGVSPKLSAAFLQMANQAGVPIEPGKPGGKPDCVHPHTQTDSADQPLRGAARSGSLFGPSFLSKTETLEDGDVVHLLWFSMGSHPTHNPSL